MLLIYTSKIDICMLTCILQCCYTYLLVLVSIFVDSLWFSTKIIISFMKRVLFLHLRSIWVVVLFLCFRVLTRTSSMTLNRMVKMDILAWFPFLQGKQSLFHHEAVIISPPLFLVVEVLFYFYLDESLKNSCLVFYAII